MSTASVRALALALGLILPLADRAVAASPATPDFRVLGRWDPSYSPPRTPDGRPDLQGVWTNASLTTMTRPPHLKLPIIRADEIAQATAAALDRQKPTGDAPKSSPSQSGADSGLEYAKVNGEYRSSWITTPADGQIPWRLSARLQRIPPAEAAIHSDNTGPEMRTLGERCLISDGGQAGPPLTNAMSGNAYQIVQTQSHVAINAEMNHDVRIAAIGDSVRPPAIRPWFGDSVAKWDGDALVIETRNIHPLQERFGAYPLSAKGLVTERFRRVSDQELLYQFRVDDPEYYYGVWSGEVTLRKSDARIAEQACHERNQALPETLRKLRRAGAKPAGLDKAASAPRDDRLLARASSAKGAVATSSSRSKKAAPLITRTLLDAYSRPN